MSAALPVWRLLVFWLVLVGYLFAAAGVKSAHWGNSKAEFIYNNQLRKGEYDHETGQVIYEPQPQQNYAALKKSDYLLSYRGVDNPALRRELFLQLAGRRLHSAEPLEPIYWDHAWHQGLWTACLEDYPDDPLVRQAAGCLLVVAGEHNQAMELLEETKNSVLLDEYYYGSWMARRMYEDELVLFGREGELEAQLYADWQKGPNAASFAWAYLRILLAAERYEEMLSILTAHKQQWKQYRDYWTWLGQARVYMGRLDEYRSQILAEISDPEAPGNNRYHIASALFWRQGSTGMTTGDLVERFSLDWQTAELYRRDQHLLLADHRFDIADSLWPDPNRYRAGTYEQHLAELYLATGDPELLARLEASYQDAREWDEQVYGQPDSPPRNPEVPGAKEALGILLLGCYCRHHDWDKAEQLEAEFAVGDTYFVGAERQEARLLCALARGESLDGLNIRRLYGNGFLPELLLSERFRAALAESGRDREEVLAEIRSIAKPWCPPQNPRHPRVRR